MAALTKPQYARINASRRPRGLKLCLPFFDGKFNPHPDTPFDKVPARIGTSVSIASTPRGAGAKFANTSASNIAYAIDQPGNMTLEVGFYTGATIANQSVAFFNAANDGVSSTTADRSLYFDGSSHLNAYIFDGASKLATDSTTVYTANTFYLVHFTSDGTTIRLYVNGVQTASLAAGNGFTSYPGGPFWVFGGGDPGNSVGNLNSGITAVLANYSTVTLSANEIKQRAQDIFGMFLRRQEIDLFAQPASGGSSIALTAVSATGAAASLTPDVQPLATGASATAAAGVAIGIVEPSFSGVAATAGAITSTPSVGANLAGAAASGQAGNLAGVNLGGVAATAGAGTLTPQAAIGAQSAAASAAAGAVTANGSIPSASIAASAAVGTMKPSIGAVPVTASAAGQAGSVGGVNAGGASASAGAAGLGVASSITLSGAAAAASAASFTGWIAISPSAASTSAAAAGEGASAGGAAGAVASVASAAALGIVSTIALAPAVAVARAGSLVGSSVAPPAHVVLAHPAMTQAGVAGAGMGQAGLAGARITQAGISGATLQ